jgi:hypothetical protein
MRDDPSPPFRPYTQRFEGGIVNIPDLIREGADVILRDVHFKGCRLEGPCVLAFTGPTRFSGTTNLIVPPALEYLKDDPNYFFWLRPEGEVFVGAIGIDNIWFEDCGFDGIGFAGSEGHRKWLHDSFSIGRWDEEIFDD